MRAEKTRTFTGRWITSDEFCSLEPINVFHRQLDKTPLRPTAYVNKHILFRRKFRLDELQRSWLYISADDYYKLYINGKFVTQGPAPSYWMHYNYNKVDVTDYLKPGENTIAVHTYYQGLINRVWTSGDDRHGLILDLECGKEVVLSSDETFRCAIHSSYSAMGRFGYDTQFAERYDAGAREVGFEQPDFDDSYWENAKYREFADYTLYEQNTSMLVFEEIRPVLTERTAQGYFIDFGSNYVGYPVFIARGEKKTAVTVHCGQELTQEKEVRWHLRANCNYEEEMVLSGGWDTVRFYDYKSFRYMELILPDGCELDESSVFLHARHYPFELKASPNTDDPELLRIWDLCVHTLKYGAQEVIQDCMEREKGFYLGDGCYTVLAHSMLSGDDSLMRKLIDDALRSAFITDGLVTCLDCSVMQEIAEYSLMLVPLVLVYDRLHGEEGFLEDRYEGLTRLLESYRLQYENSDGLLSDLDKWCVVEWPQPYRDGYDVDITEGQICRTPHNVINAWYIAAVKAFNRISEKLGYGIYRDTQLMTQNYVRAFYDDKKKLFRDSTQTGHISFPSNAVAYAFDLCPDEECRQNILKMSDEKAVTSSMFFITFPLLFGLRRDGELERVKRILLHPGAWKRMLCEDATTTFEGWGKDTKWNTSLFHLTLSYASLFLCDEFWNRIGV